jgi:hypothetical protein
VSRKILVDDDAAQYDEILARLRRLENPVLEQHHYIGAAGEPAFLHGWSNLGGGWQTLRFWKNDGIVQIQGVVTGGALGAVGSGDVFVLPDGYRPDQRLLLPTDSNNAHGTAHIYPTGEVVARIGSSTAFSLFFSFREATA